MTDLSTLLSRVESGSGALDDETLARVLCALQGAEYGGHGIATGDDGSDDFWVDDASGNRVETFARGGYRGLCPDVSVDAVVALVEARRPDANCHGYDKDPKGVTGYISRNCVAEGHWLSEGHHATSPARALLAALIWAEMEKVK